MYAPSDVATAPATAGAVAPLRSLAAGAAGVVAFAPSVPGGGGWATPPGVVDGDGAMAAGAGGELGVDVVGAGAGAIGETDGDGLGVIATGDGAMLGVAAAGAGDGGDDAGLGIGTGATGGGTAAGGGAWRPLRSAMTTTMSFSPARQLASLPLMKKKGPDLSNVNTVLPSSNLPPPPATDDDDVLHASYAP
uniref:Uncharacterized protein n=1 Tax=Oryza punctata TaxID=4537 RepID=A0A0E0LER2_ORYPU